MDIQHIFPKEEGDCIHFGNIVSAIWLPNGQFYDAKVLQKGSKGTNICSIFVILSACSLWLLVSFASYFSLIHLTFYMDLSNWSLHAQLIQTYIQWTEKVFAYTMFNLL